MLALRKLQVKNLTPKATNPTPNQLQLYTVPSLRVGRSAHINLPLPPPPPRVSARWKKHSVKQRRSRTSEHFRPRSDQDNRTSVQPQYMATMVAALVRSDLSDL